MRLPEAVSSLNLGRGARRVTRSSFGSVPDSPSKNKMQNRNTGKKNTEKSAATRTESKKLVTLCRSLEKTVKVKLTAIEKKLAVTKESKQAKHSVTEPVLNIKNLIKSKPNSQKSKQVIIKDSERMTRSSFGSETGSTSSPIRSAVSKSRQIVGENNPSVITKISKKVTCSSLGSVTSSTLMRNKNSEHKLSLSPPVQSSGRQSRLKKNEPISSEDSKRMTRSSLASETSTSISLRNRSPVLNNVAPPLLEHAEKHKNPENVIKPTKRLARSNLGDVSSTSSIVQEMRECMVVLSPLRQSVLKIKQNNLFDRNVKKTDKKVIQNYSKQDNLSDRSEAVKKTKESDKSTNTKKKTQSATIGSTPVAPTSGPRRKSSLHSGSLSVMEKEEMNPVSSKTSKGGKRKTKVSPCIEGKRKREPSPAIPASIEDPISTSDYLTDKFSAEGSNKKPRRHTVPRGTKGANTVSTTQRKSRKKSSIKSQRATPKSSSASRKVSSSTFTPDTSLLPVDSISTFMSKRPNSAPSAIVKRSLVKGLNSSIPKKGTLKRKRWLISTLKEKNECYEDDIFENQKFGTPMRLPTEPDDESDTSIATPKFEFLLTPAALPKKLSKFKDCISPTDLLLARKCAEEYQFRRQHRKRTGNNTINLKTPASAKSHMSTSFGQVPEKKKLEFAETMNKVKTIQNNIQKLAEDESEEEDDYFSDLCT